MHVKCDCVQDQYHFVYRVIDEHVNRIESSPAVHRRSRTESPTASPRSTPCRTPAPGKSVSYWHKWVSPDELPCRDIKPPCSSVPQRSLPRRCRKSEPASEPEPPSSPEPAPRSQRPCVQKRKSRTSDTEESKKQRKETRVRERSPSAEREKMTRSVSPCYNLPTTKLPCNQTRRHTKAKTSPTQRPKTDDPCEKFRLSDATKTTEPVRRSPRDCRRKPRTSDSYTKRPCTKLDQTISTEVPQAGVHGKGPCRDKASTSAPRDLITKPCAESQQLAKERPCEQFTRGLSRSKIDSDTGKPCRQMKPDETKPQATVAEGKPRSSCAEKESPDRTETSDLPKERPCKQQGHVARKEAHESAMKSLEHQQPRKDKPCKHATEMEKPSTKPDQRASSTERKCKSQLETDDHAIVQSGGSKDEQLQERIRTVLSTQASAQLPSKCNQTAKPAASDAEKLPKSVSIPAQSPGRTGEMSAGKPCDKLKSTKTTETVIPTAEKPCTKKVVEETPQSKKRQGRRKYEDRSGKEDSAITSTKTREETIQSKKKDCKQKSTLKTYEQKPSTAEETLSKRDTPVRSFMITEKPCKQSKAGDLKNTAEKGTDVGKKTTTEGRNTKQPTSLIKEKPCKKNAAEHDDKTSAQQQLTEKRETKKDSAVKSSNMKESTTQSKEKPCKKNKALPEQGKEKYQPVSTAKKTCQEKKVQQESAKAEEFTETDTEKYVMPQKSPRMKDVNKQKPCQQKTDAKIPISGEEVIEANVQQVPGRRTQHHEATSEEEKEEYTASYSPRGDPDRCGCPETEESNIPHKTERCKGKPAVESTVQTQPAEDTTGFTETEENDNDNQFNTEEDHSGVEEPRARCLTDTSDGVIAWMSQTSSLLSAETETSTSKQESDSTANKAVPVRRTQHREETCEEDKGEHTASYLPRGDPDRCGCPEAEESKAPWRTKQDIPSVSNPVLDEKKETQSGNEEEADDCEKLTSTVLDTKSNPVPNEMADQQQLVASESPCPKSRMLSTDKSVESTTHLIGRCRKARILKVFKYKKKLPSCKSALLPDSSESLQSGTGLSPYPSTVDQEQLSDSESNQKVQKGAGRNEISDSSNSKLVQRLSGSQEAHILSGNIQDEKPLVMSDTTEPVEPKKLIDKLESADFTSRKKTADCMQSFTKDPDETLMRKVQSDDGEVVTRRQNLSREIIVRNSEPSMDVSDDRAQTVTAKSSKSKYVRKDSGIEPPGKNTKPLKVPGTVVEDLSTPLEWDSSDDTSTEAATKANVPQKLDSNNKQQTHAVKGGRKVRADSGINPAVLHRVPIRVPDKVEEVTDELENWDSDEESVSETSAMPSVPSSVPVATQDTNKRDIRYSCNEKTSDKLLDTDWSTGSMSHREYVQPQQKTPASNSTAKQNFGQKSSTAETQKFDSHDQKAQNVGSVDQSARRAVPVSVNSRPCAEDTLTNWEDFIASFKLDGPD